MSSKRFGLVFAGAILLPLTVGFRACAQFEIDPDHFDSPNTEPFPQPKPPTNTQIGTIRYDGEFALPHEVRCNGRSLHPGKYSVSLRSNGKVGRPTLNQKGHTTQIAGVVQTQAVKRRNEVIVANSGKGRTLSVIRVSGFDFVFDPKYAIDCPPESKGARLEAVPLTVFVPNGIANRASSLASRKP
jgi:hypothetical protein